MKKITALILVVLIISSFAVISISADDESYDKTYMRFNDYVGKLSENEITYFNTTLNEKIGEYKMDFPVCLYDVLPYEEDIDDHAQSFYKINNFGYGKGRSGVLLVVNYDIMKAGVYFFGIAVNVVSSENKLVLNKLINTLIKDTSKSEFVKYDLFYKELFKVLDSSIKDAKTINIDIPLYILDKEDNENGMPYWYPLDTYGFTDYHADGLPYVVDDADIFTQEEEYQLSEKIEAIVKKYNVSYVAFTDDDNHGLSPEYYSSDFLHFNGYGDENGYGAVVFYLSLDPKDRCWLTTSINTYEKLFTSDVTYEIDEYIDDYIYDGDYFTAFMKHAEFIDDYFARLTDLPSWYPEGTDVMKIQRSDRVYSKSVNLSKPRIYDNANLFSVTNKEKISKQLAEMSEKYGYDVLVFTDNERHAVTDYNYFEDYLYYNGYSDNSVVLYIVENGGYYNWAVFKHGQFYDKYKDKEIAERVTDLINKGDYDGALNKYTSTLNFLLMFGFLPLGIFTILFIVLAAFGGGAIAGGIRVSGLKSGMNVVRPEGAKGYLDQNSLKIRNYKETFLYSNIVKTPIATKSSSGRSGGGGGGSHHSSGHSSGGSFSSGGRRF